MSFKTCSSDATPFLHPKTTNLGLTPLFNTQMFCTQKSSIHKVGRTTLVVPAFYRAPYHRHLLRSLPRIAGVWQAKKSKVVRFILPWRCPPMYVRCGPGERCESLLSRLPHTMGIWLHCPRPSPVTRAPKPHDPIKHPVWMGRCPEYVPHMVKTRRFTAPSVPAGTARRLTTPYNSTTLDASSGAIHLSNASQQYSTTSSGMAWSLTFSMLTVTESSLRSATDSPVTP